MISFQWTYAELQVMCKSLQPNIVKHKHEQIDMWSAKEGPTILVTRLHYLLRNYEEPMMQSYDSNRTQTVPGTFITKNLFTWVKTVPVIRAVWVSTTHQSDGKIQIRLVRDGGAGDISYNLLWLFRVFLICFAVRPPRSSIGSSAILPWASVTISEPSRSFYWIPLSFNNLLYWEFWQLIFFFLKKDNIELKLFTAYQSYIVRGRKMLQAISRCVFTAVICTEWGDQTTPRGFSSFQQWNR